MCIRDSSKTEGKQIDVLYGRRETGGFHGWKQIEVFNGKTWKLRELAVQHRKPLMICIGFYFWLICIPVMKMLAHAHVLLNVQ